MFKTSKEKSQKNPDFKSYDISEIHSNVCCVLFCCCLFCLLKDSTEHSSNSNAKSKSDGLWQALVLHPAAIHLECSQVGSV